MLTNRSPTQPEGLKTCVHALVEEFLWCSDRKLEFIVEHPDCPSGRFVVSVDFEQSLAAIPEEGARVIYSVLQPSASTACRLCGK
jgi:hypothetical protein